MIEAKINGSEVKRLLVGGSLTDIVTELGLVCALVYSSVDQKDKRAGKIFKEMFIDGCEKMFFDENILETAMAEDDSKDDESSKLDEVIKALKTLTDFVGEDDDSDEDKHFRS